MWSAFKQAVYVSAKWPTDAIGIYFQEPVFLLDVGRDVDDLSLVRDTELFQSYGSFESIWSAERVQSDIGSRCRHLVGKCGEQAGVSTRSVGLS